MKDKNAILKAAWSLLVKKLGERNLDEFVGMAFDAMAPDSENGPYMIGDWNEHADLGREIEALGCEIVFGDDHAACADCHGMVETEPSWFGWKPRYIIADGGLVCDRCSPTGWSIYLPEKGEVGINLDYFEVSNRRGGILLCKIPEGFDYDAVDSWLETQRVEITKAAKGDVKALAHLREGIKDRLDVLPPVPQKVDDHEPWQEDLLDAVTRYEHGWRAFVPVLEFDPECSWGADEGDDRSERERQREARERPWVAYMSMPGCLDTSYHVRHETAKGALHELVQQVMEWPPQNCTEEAYEAAVAAMREDS